MNRLPNTSRIAAVKRLEMKCYFSAKTPEKDKLKKQNGLICFAIPGVGVVYKTRSFGSQYELEYISFLSLLRFIEVNQKAFENQKINIMCSSPLLVYQMNENSGCLSEVRQYRHLALVYKRRLNFSLSWVPETENRAQNGMMNLPPLKVAFDFNFEDLPRIIG
ncbi:MAG TPA: hypothetical protein VF369_06190 [candidate division Zixibacteria bacterium]